MFCIVLGSKKNQKHLGFPMHNKCVSISAEVRKKERKEKWQTRKILMNPTAIDPL